MPRGLKTPCYNADIDNQAYKLMASIDKQSIRAEYDKIKASFDEQVQSGKVSSETAALFNTLMMLFNIILSIFMEKNTKKTSSNSSIPLKQHQIIHPPQIKIRAIRMRRSKKRLRFPVTPAPLNQ